MSFLDHFWLIILAPVINTLRNTLEKARTSDVIVVSVPSVACWPNLKALPDFSTVYLETSQQPGEKNMDIQRGLIWFLRDQFLMNVDDSSWLVSAKLSSSGGDQKLGVSKLTK